MVKDRVGTPGWLRRRIEDADTDLLREMVKSVTEVFVSAEASAASGSTYRDPSAFEASRKEHAAGMLHPPKPVDRLGQGPIGLESLPG